MFIRTLCALILSCFCMSFSFASNVEGVANEPKYTYTYLRCYYQTMQYPKYPAYTTYIWAENKDKSSFKLNGYWAYPFGVTPSNMFYTQVSQRELHDVCRSTLASHGLGNKPYMNFFAADTISSYDYTVWTNDAPNRPDKINKMIVFGDSLSDNGNLFNTTQWRVPNQFSWAHGRFTNGKVWIEYVSDRLGLPMYDWAVANTRLNPKATLNMASQITSYEKLAPLAKNYDPAHSLFIFWCGENDIVDELTIPVSAIVEQSRVNLERLIADGAKHILVLNLPDTSVLPDIAISFKKDLVHQRTDEMNKKLEQLVSELAKKYKDKVSKIYLVDINVGYMAVASYPSQFGLTDVEHACFKRGSFNFFSYYPLSDYCSNPDTIFSWDGFHPTGAMHRFLGDYVAQFISQNYSIVTPPKRLQ